MGELDKGEIQYWVNSIANILNTGREGENYYFGLFKYGDPLLCAGHWTGPGGLIKRREKSDSPDCRTSRVRWELYPCTECHQHVAWAHVTPCQPHCSCAWYSDNNKTIPTGAIYQTLCNKQFEYVCGGVCGGDLLYFIDFHNNHFQMRELGLRDVKWLAQRRTAH